MFLLRSARNPRGYLSFLNFTMWANLAHGVLMVVQAATELDRYWSKFLTDIPFVLILAAGIYLWPQRIITQSLIESYHSAQVVSSHSVRTIFW